MTSPLDEHKEYNELYHKFTEAYINVHSLTRDFYPLAKKFVEHTEPELTDYMEKISNNAGYKGGPFAYQKLIQYINHFDEFTMNANKLFGELKAALHRSDDFMTRVIDLKISTNSVKDNTTAALYKGLMPELKELTTTLQQIPEKAAVIEEKMKQLEASWKKTKEKLF